MRQFILFPNYPLNVLFTYTLFIVKLSTTQLLVKCFELFFFFCCHLLNDNSSIFCHSRITGQSIGGRLMPLKLSIHILTLVLLLYGWCHLLILCTLSILDSKVLLEGCFTHLLHVSFIHTQGFYWPYWYCILLFCFQFWRLLFFMTGLFSFYFFYLQHVFNINQKQAHIWRPCGWKHDFDWSE